MSLLRPDYHWLYSYAADRQRGCDCTLAVSGKQPGSCSVWENGSGWHSDWLCEFGLGVWLSGLALILTDMEFLRSLVPAVISGDVGAVESGGALPRETGPRLLRMKRLLAIGQTTEEDQQGLVNNSTTRPIRSNHIKGTDPTGWHWAGGAHSLTMTHLYLSRLQRDLHSCLTSSSVVQVLEVVCCSQHLTLDQLAEYFVTVSNTKVKRWAHKRCDALHW